MYLGPNPSAARLCWKTPVPPAEVDRRQKLLQRLVLFALQLLLAALGFSQSKIGFKTRAGSHRRATASAARRVIVRTVTLP